MKKLSRILYILIKKNNEENGIFYIIQKDNKFNVTEDYYLYLMDKHLLRTKDNDDIYAHFAQIFGPTINKYTDQTLIKIKEFESCTKNEIDNITIEKIATECLEKLSNREFLLSEYVSFSYRIQESKIFFDLLMKKNESEYDPVYKNYAFLLPFIKHNIRFYLNERIENYSHVGKEMNIGWLYYPHILIDNPPFRYRSQFNTVEFNDYNIQIDFNDTKEKIIKELEKYTFLSKDHKVIVNFILCNLASNYLKIKNIFDFYSKDQSFIDRINDTIYSDVYNYIKRIFIHDNLLDNVVMFFSQYCEKLKNVSIDVGMCPGDPCIPIDEYISSKYVKAHSFVEYNII